MLSLNRKRLLLGATTAVSMTIAFFAMRARNPTVPTAPPATEPPRVIMAPLARNEAPGPLTNNDAAAGRRIFAMNCAHCHGDDATGDECPNLHGLRKSDERIARLVTQGIKGEMPSFRKKLDDAQVGRLIAYLRTLREG